MKPQQKDSRASELIEKVKALKDRQPYSWLLESEDITVRHAGENALLGWMGAIDLVLVVLEGEDGV